MVWRGTINVSTARHTCWSLRRYLSNSGSSSFREATSPSFGLLFDIDGVIVRGKKVFPFAPDAFKKLVDTETKQWRVPTVFVTNAGNRMRQKKADQLSGWLGVEVSEEQVVMSHSPLKMYSDFHEKHVLVTGQGPVRDIATNLGFKKVTTMKELRHAFPALDAVDMKRRRVAPCAFESYFPNIEGIVLFGEPIRWETSLQLLLDVLITNGHPATVPPAFPHPHLPILACNMDLQWMAEACLPRFGHGAFLLSLENLYKKITGFDLVYTALIGKPSEITYRHSEHVLQEHAQKIGWKTPVKNIYCIGDNICTDIFGANLYNKYLQRRLHETAREATWESANAAGSKVSGGNSSTSSDNKYYSNSSSRCIDHLVGSDELNGAENCYSVLVETGVYSTDAKEKVSLNHSPRDFLPVEESFQEPTFVVRNVLEAVNLVFKREAFA